MFGYTIVKKEFIRDIENDLDNCEYSLSNKERKISKTKNVLYKIKNESKQMNKNEIVNMCNELLKEIK